MLKKRTTYLSFALAVMTGCANDIPEHFATRYETSERVQINNPYQYHYERTSKGNLAVHDFQNKVFYRAEDGCGDKRNQGGSRHSAAVVSVLGSENLVLRNAHFECSTQNTIIVENSNNVVLENISAAFGSDNALEIRDSKYVIVKDSLFSDVRGNKCVETENSVVFFVNVFFTRCEKGFAGERTSVTEPDIIFFIDSRINVLRDEEAYAFVCDSRVSAEYGIIYLIGSQFNAKNVNCRVSRELPEGLLLAIEESDFDAIEALMEPIISDFGN